MPARPAKRPGPSAPSGAFSPAFFAVTPPALTDALLDNEPFPESILEPACGDGTMAEAIRDRGYVVEASDLYDRGYGKTGIDFLDRPRMSEPRAMVTNPPFALFERFARHALTLDFEKFALLAPLAYLAGQRRQALFNAHPPRRVLVVSRRVSIWPAGVELSKNQTTFNVAWFIWYRRGPGRRPSTIVDWA